MNAIMTRMMGQNNNLLYYTDHDNPLDQFVGVLIKGKELEIIASNPKILEAVAKLSLTIRVSLLGCEEDCWRIIRIPASTSLAVLHDQILGPVMGWCRGYHGYVFEDNLDGTVYGPKDYSGYIDMMHVGMHYHAVMDDRSVPIAAILREVNDQCTYVYDLGDNWRHSMKVIAVNDVDGGSSVEILDGYGACPPEDSNGLKGMGNSFYVEFLDAYKKNKNASKVQQTIREIENSASNYKSHYVTGAPIKFDPTNYDITLHRYTTEFMIAGPRIQKPKDMMMNTFKENSHKCAACNDRLKPLLTCAACKTEKYCSKECQASHWKVHKSLCKVISGKK